MMNVTQRVLTSRLLIKMNLDPSYSDLLELSDQSRWIDQSHPEYRNRTKEKYHGKKNKK